VTVGFVGLGSMGAVLAANLVGAGHDVLAYDVAGPDRTPPGARFAPDVSTLARDCEVVVLSLPDGAASQAVTRQLAAAGDARVRHVVDTSTIGPTAAAAIVTLLAEAGIGYVDAPVSGGVAGARARTLMVMVAATDTDADAVAPVVAGLSDRSRRVGDRPGLAQALKLANNFLSAITLAATSEAVAFGTAVGLDMATMVGVLDASSGQSAATSDKFPRHVLTGTYAAGFANTLMAKDLRLYLDELSRQGTAGALGGLTGQIWQEFATADPGVDFTRIYAYLSGT
jgi:3-hydroxyisobutyrate dehydrogenase-like beta-hydroxyacid dehydrogenase